MEENKDLKIILKRAMKNRKIAYIEQESGDNMIGFILEAIGDIFIVQHIDFTGKDAGLSINLISTVTEVDMDTDFLNDVFLLTKGTTEYKEDEIKIKNINPFLSFIQYAYEQNKLISFSLLLETAVMDVGEVLEIEEDNIWLQLVNPHGEKNGKGLINLEAMTSVSCGGEVEGPVEILYRENEGGADNGKN